MAKSIEQTERVLLIEEKFVKKENLAVEYAAMTTTPTEKKWDKGQPIIVETLDTRGRPEMTSMEEMENAIINPAYPKHTIKVGMDISKMKWAR